MTSGTRRTPPAFPWAGLSESLERSLPLRPASRAPRRRHEQQRFDVFRELGRVHGGQESSEGVTHQDELLLAEDAADALAVGNLGADPKRAFEVLHVCGKV